MPKRAVLYARVSGDDRHTEGRNLAGQLELCREYAEEHGYEVVAELAEDDRGAPGAAFELPQLNRVRELARVGGFDILVVREMDRLSRRLAKQLFVEEELRRAGITIEYVKGVYEETPEGNLMKNVRAVVAEYERLKITERTTAARYRAVEEGSVLGHGLATYGYRLVRDGAKWKLVIDPQEAAIVRLMFEWYLHGENGGRPMNGCQIAQALTARQEPTATDKGLNRRKLRGVGAWSPASVARMLRDETYAGVWHYRKYETTVGADGRRHRYTRPRKEWMSVQVPAIVDRATWDAAVERRHQNVIGAKRNLQHEDLYLLRRRIVCGACGVKMNCIPPTTSKPRAYYQCPATRRTTHFAHVCSAHSFRSDWVDARVWAWLRNLVAQPAAIEVGRNDLEERVAQVDAPLAAELTALDERLGDLSRQRERLLRAHLAGLIDEEQFAAETKRLRKLQAQQMARRADLEESHRKAAISQRGLVEARAFADDVATRLNEDEGNHAFRRFVAEKLNTRVTLVETESGKKIIASCALHPQPTQL